MAASCRSTQMQGGITAEEIRRISKALHKQEFRDLLLDYVKEVNDPANRTQYEAEVAELEKQRGYYVTFLRPEPCYVLKTTVSMKAKNTKAFINICQCVAIEKPSCKRVSQAIARSFYNQDSGLMWTVPHSLSYPRDDTDRQGNKCLVYDCVYHPDTLRLANSNHQFKQMIEEIAFDAVENAFSVNIKRTGVKYPKMKFKGVLSTTILRKKIDDKDSDPVSNLAPCEKNESESLCVEYSVVPKRQDRTENAVVPEYVLKYRHKQDMLDFAYIPTSSSELTTTAPDELVIEIKLPAVQSVSDIILDVTHSHLNLSSCPSTIRYALSIKLPFSVDDGRGSAKFRGDTKTLLVELPVLKLVTINNTSAVSEITKEIRNDCVIDEAITKDCNITEAVVQYSSVDEDQRLVENMSQLEITQNMSNDSVLLVNPPLKAVDTPSTDTIRISGNLLENVGSTVSSSLVSAKVTYSLPEFSCHQSNSEIVFVIKTQNIVQASIKLKYFENGIKCRLSFLSTHLDISTPEAYSLFLLLLPECKLDVGQEKISVMDGNAVVTLIKHEDSQHHWDTFRYGVDEANATHVEVLSMSALQRKLLILQNQIPIISKQISSSTENATKVAVTEVNCERLKIEIEEIFQHNGPSSTTDDSQMNKDPDADNSVTENGSQAVPHIQERNHNHDDEHIDQKNTPAFSCNNTGFSSASHRLRKFRSTSESSDDVSPVHYPRSILKHTRRSHTLSESSDDFSWSSQDYTTVDLNIPEEGGIENLSSPIRKAVHFNEIISRNFFRSNSSILGQRKKNQRKQRKKFESRIRRSSESEGSEVEPENQEGPKFESTSEDDNSKIKRTLIPVDNDCTNDADIYRTNGDTDFNQNYNERDNENLEMANERRDNSKGFIKNGNINDNDNRISTHGQINKSRRKKKKQLAKQKINIEGDDAVTDKVNTLASAFLCSKSCSSNKLFSSRKRTVSI